MAHVVQQVRLVRIGLPRMSEKWRAAARIRIVPVWLVSAEAGLLAVRVREVGGERYAILHRNTKAQWRDQFPWQLTRFDSRGPIGDTPRATAAQALTDGLDVGGRWEVEAIVCRAVRDSAPCPPAPSP